jgi:hypothetical protein
VVQQIFDDFGSESIITKKLISTAGDEDFSLTVDGEMFHFLAERSIRIPGLIGEIRNRLPE